MKQKKNNSEINDNIAALSERLGHVFQKPELLLEALTHPSLTTSNGKKKSDPSPYERLEFLGDRVLGLVVAEWLYELFPNEREGGLARRHAALVNRDALRIVAQKIELGKFLRLAHGETAEGSAHKNLVTLSDAQEAVIGALYLEAGLDKARTFIRTQWKEQAFSEKATEADPKTALQEWAQGQGLPLPAYAVVENSGPAHAPKFVVEVRVKNYPATQAEGASKRQAEKAAAAALLKIVELKNDK